MGFLGLFVHLFLHSSFSPYWPVLNFSITITVWVSSIDILVARGCKLWLVWWSFTQPKGTLATVQAYPYLSFPFFFSPCRHIHKNLVQIYKMVI